MLRRFSERIAVVSIPESSGLTDFDLLKSIHATFMSAQLIHNIKAIDEAVVRVNALYLREPIIVAYFSV